MAFNGAFTITSVITPGSFILNDTTTGSDSNLTDRKISLYQADGTLLGGVPIDFPYTMGNSITLNVLNIDYCLLIAVQWISSSPLPPPSSYSASGLYNFLGNSYYFLNNLIGAIQSNPNILNDVGFDTNLSKLQTDIDCSSQASSTGQQASAQAALSRIQSLIVNQNYFF
jgi:hypothetical protein